MSFRGGPSKALQLGIVTGITESILYGTLQDTVLDGLIAYFFVMEKVASVLYPQGVV